MGEVWVRVRVRAQRETADLLVLGAAQPDLVRVGVRVRHHALLAHLARGGAHLA